MDKRNWKVEDLQSKQKLANQLLAKNCMALFLKPV